VIVVDASAVVVAVVETSPRADRVRATLTAAGPTVAPDHVDAEIGQSVRGLVLRSQPPAEFAYRQLILARRLVVGRRRLGPLIERAWGLRANVSFYDGLYIALAERLGVALLTADRRLAAANGPRCPIELV
jgi:predicted nucleic acid-binding protein